MRFACLIAFLFAIPTVPLSAQEIPESARKAKAVLEKHCHSCHGDKGTNEGGFNFVLNRDRLVAGKKIVPSDPKTSQIHDYMVRGKMPKEEDLDGNPIKVRPSKEEIDSIKAWIAAGAPDFDRKTAPREFISNTDILDLIQKDLKKANVRSQKFLRYFTITHLYNAGLSDDELLSYRVGLSKLVNSLSWGREVKVPEPIDPAQTIFRIDLRQFGWKESTWERILAANPYGLTYETAGAKACYAACGTAIPHIRADWFVFAASRPPLYHDVLELPKTDLELEKLLHIDVLENIRTEEVARAAFNGSGVSGNNRLIERHKASYGAYWKSYDFNGNTGKKSLFERPLGPGKADSQFQHDGGEIIFSLPNGLQAYFLTGPNGERIDKGPIEVVSDPLQKDRKVVNGVSCMRCHFAGMIDKADQIRDHVERNPEGFRKLESDLIKALYPPKEDFAKLLKEDAERFRDAVGKCGSCLGKTDPVFALSRQFEKEIDLNLAAGEVGVRAVDFAKDLSRSPNLARVFGTLRVPGGTVQRQAFVEHFNELVAVMVPDGTFHRASALSDHSSNETTIVPVSNKPIFSKTFPKVKLVWIPAGKFLMGSPEDEKDRSKDETQHEVNLTKDFFMGEFTVTVGQWKVFQKETGHDAKAGAAPGFKQDDDHPVVNVSHKDAVVFCAWLSEKDGRTYRLPTEAEWEYACRVGTKTAFSFGEKLNGNEANCNGNYPYGTKIKGRYLKGTAKVGSYKSNAFGLYDMHGNVWQWCEDFYGDYKAVPAGNNPQQISSQSKESSRVLRGGSWYYGSQSARSANRGSYVVPSSRNDGVGFRVVLLP